MASQFLITPNLEARLGGLQGLASKISINRLGAAIVRDYSNISIAQSSPETKIWLLGHFIAIYHSRERREQEPEMLRALSLQLSECSVDIIGRIDRVEPTANSPQINESSDVVEVQVVPSLPIFIKTQLMSLLNQASITGLLKRFNV